MEPITIVIRVLITFVLSMLFGMDRQRAHKPLGFGTFTFVSIGACAMAIIAIDLDSPALLSAIVTGIGFLGAGALIKTGEKLFGATSAASIWLFAIFGLIIGIGEFFIGILVYVLVWAILFFDKHLEKKGIGSYQRKLIITTNKIITDADLKDYLSIYTKKYKTVSVEIDKKNNKAILNYVVEGSRDNLNKIIKHLYKEAWVESCKVE